ncbi:hypothetical protein L6164_026415 [Bauhinia variegata]|uniref:Uncharacterized protein n=1 Tax=Bauhinia variegata TaxID=167791 RepID=A0ACB9LQM3_BAUVA|nr:hypothetical protein L6164_026415 [Bauhinia variegata]
MHDVVQDVAIFLASRQYHLFIRRYQRLEEWPEGDQLTSCETIILDRSDIAELPQELYCPNLTFFHLNNKNQFLNIADDFFEGMRELTVLNLAGETLNSLPSSINLLCNLRALCLNLYVFRDLGIIGRLKGLKVLTLSSEMMQLPPELCQLNQLQLLDLRGCCKLELIPPNLLSSLTKLQELYFAIHIYSTPIQWYVDDPNYKQQSMKHHGKEVFDGASDPNNQQSKTSLGELNNLARLTNLETHICDEKMLPKDLVFERLRRYKVIIGSDPNLSSSEYETSRMLKLNLNTSIHSWDNVKSLLDSVEELHLYHLKGAENVVPGTSEEGMPQLKYLHLCFSDEIQTIVDLSRRNLVVDIFPNIESLVIECCTNLEEICNGSLTGRSFSRLKVIKVANCGKMKSLFSVSSFRGRPHCNIMEETNENPESMLQFTELREDNIPHTPIALFNDKVMLPNLEEMIIIYVVKLNTIWHQQQQLCPKSFDKLRKLEIENCPKLVIIFPSHIGSSINSLETLLITNCKSLEHVFEETHCEISGVPASVLCFPNLQQVMLPNMEEMIIVGFVKLKMVFNCQQNLTSDSFGRLKKIEIKNCPELLSLLPYHIMSRARSLETLTVVNSKSLEQIFSYQGANARETHDRPADLPNLLVMHVEGLLHLEVQDCCVLKELVPSSTSFNHLRILQICKCDGLLHLVTLSTAKSLVRLETLIIKECSMMKEIVINEENEDGDHEITFSMLKFLELQQLSSLRSFSTGNFAFKFPSLENFTRVEKSIQDADISYVDTLA